MTVLIKWLPLIWLAVTIGLCVLEATTVDLVAIWFALGSFVAMIVSLFNAPPWLQVLIFIVVAITALASTRRIVKQKLNVRKVRTNLDSVVGKIGIVLDDIDNFASKGRVNAIGLDWTARSEDGLPIESGSHVLVKAIDGVKLIVEKID